MGVRRWHVAASLALALLAGVALALAWWDWTYPGVVLELWWDADGVYGYFWQRMLWMLLAIEGACLGLWWTNVRVGALSRSALELSPAFLSLVYLTRHWVHPVGVQPGSTIWTYGLLAVTAALPVYPLYRLWTHSRVRAALRRCSWPAACGAALVYAGVFGALSIARHDVYRTHALDLGTMDQAAWNTAYGQILERTPLYRDPADGSRYESRLLDAKLELVFFLLAALYRLWADPRLLLLAQTAALAAGAPLLYRLVHERTGLPGAALLLTLGYLLYLPLHYVHMADFHPSALMVPFLIAAWHAMRRRQWRRYYVWLALALCCRIDAAFVALALGAVIALGQRDGRRHGLYTALLAAIWLGTDFYFVVPAVRSAYGLGAGDLVSRRFGELGSDPLDILYSLVTEPRLAVTLLIGRGKVQTLLDLLMPLGFSSLLAPLALLPALPVLGINLLAGSAWQHSTHAHYMAPVIPFVWIAAGEGLAWLARVRSRAWAGRLSFFALLNTLLVAWAFSPFPPGRAFRLSEYQGGPYEAHLYAAIASVPDGVSVCAQSDLHPHLSQRRDAALFPRCRLTHSGEEAAYVVVDLDPTSVKSPMDYHAFYESVGAWLERDDYGVVNLEGSALVLRRAAPRDNVPQVLDALERYGQQLYRVAWRGGVLSPRLRADEYYRIPVTLYNAGSQSWHSRGQLPVRLSYRWLDASGEQVLSTPSLRTNLPHRVGPGRAARLRAALLTPSVPGTYTLVWDVVREGDAWFGDKGGETLAQRIEIE